MEKYALIPEQLIYEGAISEQNLFEPGYISEELILLTHEINYWNKLRTLSLTQAEIRRTGFPLTRELIDRECMIAQGTCETALFALEHRLSMNVAGGTHHAYADKGEGFCLLNDIAIAANFLLFKKLAAKILVVDLDVHQGNGTAKIFESVPEVFTFSMHGANNFPGKKEQSDLDIPLPDGTADTDYLSTLEDVLHKLFEKEKPEFVFYLSGVDVLATDKLGRLSMTKNGCKQRDLLVFKICRDFNIPVSVTMGGGYSQKISDIVDAHCNTFKAAMEVFF